MTAVTLLLVVAVLWVSVASVRCAWILYFVGITVTGLTTTIGGAVLRPEIFCVPLLALAVRSGRARALASGRAPATTAWLIAFITLSLAVSLAFAPRPLASGFIVLVMLVGVASYILLAPDEARKAQFVHDGTVVLGIVAAVSLVGYLSSRFGGPAFLERGIADDGRLIGFSFETNIFASQMTTWLALLYMRRGTLRPEAMKWVGLIIAASLLAGTRAAWIALVFIALVAARSWLRERLAVPALLLLAVLAVSFIGQQAAGRNTAGADTLTGRLTNITDVSSGTGAYRLRVYQGALDELDTTADYLLGKGVNTYGQRLQGNNNNVQGSYVSSVWVALLHDSGLFGYVLFLGAYVSMWLRFQCRYDALALVGAIAICAASTNLFWLAYPWVYLALGPVRQHEPSITPSLAPRSSGGYA